MFLPQFNGKYVVYGGPMKITRARVINYRSIDDSSWVSLEDVTALVGKNESGKTAFLQAIRKINSILSLIHI